MPEPKWGIAFGTMNDGFNFIGPFDEDSKIDEHEFSERCVAFGDEYHYFQIWSPDDFEEDQYGDLRLKKEQENDSEPSEETSGNGDDSSP